MYDVIVIGAGAAGMMAAGIAAQSGKSVLLLEKMEKAGRKIRITGKGRCNLTNVRPREEFLTKVKANADFFAPSFDDFDNQALIDFFRDKRVELTVERGDRVFPTSGKAWEIADALVGWCERMKVETQYNTRVVEIRTLGSRVCGVRIVNKNGYPRNIEADTVILCTGGVSYPATGSTGDGYMFAHNLGHSIEEVRPSLVPLEISHSAATELNGVMLKNVEAQLLIDGECTRREFGELEFSDRGIEGAVILRLSRDCVDALIDQHKVDILLDLKPALTPEVLTARIAREMEALPPIAKYSEVLRKLLPKPLVNPAARAAAIDPNTQLRSIKEAEVARTIRVLKGFTVPITDYRPFEEAVVTAGGVNCQEVDPQTLCSRLVRGLYFAGEVLDLDADTGGYNLQIAFSTGHLAGKLLANKE